MLPDCSRSPPNPFLTPAFHGRDSMKNSFWNLDHLIDAEFLDFAAAFDKTLNINPPPPSQSVDFQMRCSVRDLKEVLWKDQRGL
ncbi:hypothetical protein QE152_g32200 [Popillia japonica]|uniref:Uncharacterized protein n=1 Tax=Popillia japonica TaxID=7064 RepID=A0AAW1J0I3_POPJA